MLIPFILDYFEWLNNIYFWPVLSIILVTVGVIIHLINSVQSKNLTLTTAIILLSVLSIIYGFSLVQVHIKNAEYLSLAGILLIVVWLFVPLKRGAD
ncbi:MAG: hypothetical protein WED10_12475, partial [Brumimicrobium sp.]